MSALFDLPTEPQERRDACVSADGRYRYALWRDWRRNLERPRWVTFVMLNPSTADGTQDDPTIVRCRNFAKALGGTGLAVVNLYAFRATKPADLWKADDPVGPENDETLTSFLALAARHDSPVIAAWGASAKPDREAFVGVLAMAAGVPLTALGVTKDGAPRHPLYLRADARPERWPA